MPRTSRSFESHHKVFSEKGDKTHIDYMDRFISYKRYLVQNKDELEVQELFEHLNTTLFPSTSGILATLPKNHQNQKDQEVSDDDEADELEKTFAHHKMRNMDGQRNAGNHAQRGINAVSTTRYVSI